MRRSFWRKCGLALLRMVAALAVLAVIAGLAGFVVVQSGWFHEYVRQRIISEIEHATGGQVEIGRFSFRGPTLTASIAPFVLHGREAEGEPPLLRADSVTVGLKIISIAERKVDLAYVKIDRPRVRIVTYPDGTDNLPYPKTGGGSGNWPVQIIDLAIAHYEVADGTFELDERRTPLNLRGDRLALQLAYDPRTPAYQTDLSFNALRLVAPGIAPLDVTFASRFSLQKTRMVVSSLRLATGKSHADLSGILADPKSPHGRLKVVAAIDVREAVPLFFLPIERAGAADFSGTLDIDSARLRDFVLAGHLNARGLGYATGRLHVEDAALHADVEVTANRTVAHNLQADALGSRFEGNLTAGIGKRVNVEGTIAGLSVAAAADIFTPRPMPWNGTLSGEVSVNATLGGTDALANFSLAIAPAAEGAPIEGLIDAAYDQQQDRLALSNSYISTPATRLDASGTLGRSMSVDFRTTDLGDVVAALPLIEESAPRELPLQLNHGSIAASGTVTGSLDDPRFRGQLTVVNASLQGHAFDRFDASADLTKSTLGSSRFTLTRGSTDAAGTAALTASQGSFENASVTGQFTVRNADLEELAKEAGAGFVVQGTASAGVRLSGSVQQPQADLTLTIANPRAFGETLDRIAATLKVTKTSVDITAGQADDGPGHVAFSGAYQASAPDWKTGQMQLQVATRNLPSNRIEALTSLGTGLEARLTTDFRARAQIDNGGFLLSSASGSVSAQSVTMHGQPLGDLALTADTQGEQVSVQARGRIDGSEVQGEGAWRLSGDENGTASLRFSRLSLDDAQRLARMFGAAPNDQTPLPLEGIIDGGAATISIPLRRPAAFQSSVTLNSIRFNPRSGQVLGLGVDPQDVVLTSAQPLTIAVDSKVLRIQPARLTGRNTNLEISGTIPFAAGAGGADIAMRGAVNLVALQLVNPNLLARGNASVEATLRGALDNPALTGRMDLKGASLYVKDVTTGLDNVNGSVLFNRNRATIEKLTAQIGSGALSLGGFVEFGTPLIYRVQAAAQQIRFRLPADLSTTFSANLELNGTSDASTLSGTLTVNRAAFNPHTDLGELLEAFSAPQPESTPNDYLRGMQFDVRVASAPNFQLQTSLTRDLQPNVDLRLRGTPRQPLLLGSISVDSGQIQLFGNEYSIDRGNIRFSNPARIEPAFDLALETRVSGVTVNITFTGTTDKLRTNYSSDPPLEPSKIIALLAVGRNPSVSTTASAQDTANNTDFVGAGSSLIGEALSEQLNSKLQRFLGASRVKIDPTMTGIDSTPQARLTFEQQVSKNVTMTYITNLNYTAEQIVRLQWDLNRNWSAIAVRDANGLFGIDFQYRRRFK